MRHVAPALALCLLLVACSDSLQEVLVEECPDDQVSVTVSGGVGPVFSWTPRCGMASVNVFPTAGGASLWVVYSGQQATTNPFRSGIIYGQAPAGALVVNGPHQAASRRAVPGLQPAPDAERLPALAQVARAGDALRIL